MECEVKWALESITMNKASGGDGIPVELFQILKDDAVKVLHPICQHIWKTQKWPQDWKRSVFIPIPKKGNVKECSNYCTIALISHASKVMLKVLQARLQQYVNCEFPDVHWFYKRQRNQRSNCQHPLDHQKSKRVPEKHYLYFIEYTKASDCMDHNKPENFFISVQFSCSVVSDSLRPHEPQHASSPCPSPTPGVHSDSRPSSR